MDLSPPDDEVPADCIASQILAVADGTRCEDLGPTFCTPGDARCRATKSFGAVSVADAVRGVPYTALMALPNGSVETVVDLKASVINGSAFVTDPRGGRHLVCEMIQLSGEQRSACAAEAPPVAPAMSGWCYVEEPSESASKCPYSLARFRALGDASTRAGAVTTVMCRAYLA